MSGLTFPLPPVVDLETVWKTDGTLYTGILDSRMLYYPTSTLNVVTSTYTVGTVTCSVVGGVTRATSSGTALWATAASDVKIGDVFYCSALTGANKQGIIKAIISDTVLDLETDEGDTVGGGHAYEIRRAIWGQVKRIPDTTQIRGKLLLMDGRRRVRVWDTATTGSFANYGTTGFDSYFPYCGCFWKDRLFFGHLIESATDWRQKIRWTTTLDLTTLPVGQWLDLPYSPGHIRRLVGMANMLVCYMSDSVWFGRLTSYGDSLPVAFDYKLDTGGIGLVGDRAIVQGLGGHFFLGDDNVYFVGNNGSFEAIGDPIKDMLFSDSEALWSCRMEIDPQNTRILLTEPAASGIFSKIFSFDYRAKAWSYEEITGNFIQRRQIARGFTYDAWLSAPPYTYDTGLGIFASYDTISTTDSGNEILYIGKSNQLLIYGGTALTVDAPSSDPVSVRIESGDFDYQDPDKDKVHLRLSLRLKASIGQDLTFSVKVSTDCGLTWRTVTATGRPLTIKAGQYENYINFRARGSTFRFRLESTSACAVYTVQEMVLRAVETGVDAHLMSNR
jgi:hypothetical protein